MRIKWGFQIFVDIPWYYEVGANQGKAEDLGTESWAEARPRATD